MTRWRVHYLGKERRLLGWVEAHDVRKAIEQAAKQFNITPARRLSSTRGTKPAPPPSAACASRACAGSHGSYSYAHRHVAP
jgi:hypothetical protein